MDATNTQSYLLDSTRQLEADTKAASDAAIRAIVRNWKTLTGYPASGSEAILRLKGPADSFDPATFKPSLKVTVEPGQNRLTFNVAGCDGVKTWYRQRGTLPWRFIGFDSTAPFSNVNDSPVGSAAAGLAWPSNSQRSRKCCCAAERSVNATFPHLATNSEAVMAAQSS
jgi:hypothetical protein